MIRGRAPEKKDGQSSLPPGFFNMTFRVPAALNTRMRRFSEATGVPMTRIVTDAVTQWLDAAEARFDVKD